MDFVAARLLDGRWFRVLTVVDQFTRECLLLLLADRQNEQRGTTMIVDTHVHAVSADQVNYPRQVTPGTPGEWVRDMSAEMLLSLNAEAGIDKTVLVQAYSAYKYDNSYTGDCAAS